MTKPCSGIWRNVRINYNLQKTKMKIEISHKNLFKLFFLKYSEKSLSLTLSRRTLLSWLGKVIKIKILLFKKGCEFAPLIIFIDFSRSAGVEWVTVGLISERWLVKRGKYLWARRVWVVWRVGVGNAVLWLVEGAESAWSRGWDVVLLPRTRGATDRAHFSPLHPTH